MTVEVLKEQVELLRMPPSPDVLQTLAGELASRLHVTGRSKSAGSFFSHSHEVTLPLELKK
jgi:hypothetical protein